MDPTCGASISVLSAHATLMFLDREMSSKASNKLNICCVAPESMIVVVRFAWGFVDCCTAAFASLRFGQRFIKCTFFSQREHMIWEGSLIFEAAVLEALFAG